MRLFYRLAALAFWMTALYLVQVALAVRSLRFGAHKRHVTYAVALLAAAAGGVAVHWGTTYLTTSAGPLYYVAPAGDDANNGRSAQAPFQHIAACTQVVAPGDTCLIASGTYHEVLIPGQSGTASSPITYTAAPGAQPVIDGADTLVGFVPAAGQPAGVYQASVVLPVSGPQDAGFFANQLFVDGVMLPNATYPRNTGTPFHRTNGTIAAIGTSGANHVLTDASLTAATDSLVGAVVHIQGGQGWTYQTGRVVSNSAAAHTVTFSGGWSTDATIDPKAGSPYYIDEASGTALLTYPGAWSYDPAAHLVYLWLADGSSPTAHRVEVKARTLAADLSGKSYITLSGLQVFGATVATDAASSWDTISGITATYLSHFETIPPNPLRHQYPYWGHAYDTGIIISGTHETLSSSVLQWSAGNGVSLGGTDNTVTNNLIRYTDYSGSYDSFIRPQLDGARLTMSHNSMDTTGRGGIEFTVATTPTVPGAQATGDVVSYNDVYNVMQLTNDGGNIYAADITSTNSVIDHNWLHDLDASTHLLTGGGTGNGVYLDNGSNGWLVHHNVGWSIPQACVEINNVSAFPLVSDNFPLPHDNTTANNTCPDGQYGVRYNALGNGTTNAPNNLVGNNILGQGAGALRFEQNNSVVGTWTGISLGVNLTSNPTFTDAVHHNYSLPPGSVAIDAGAPIAGVTPAGDSAPDLGAYDSHLPLWVPGCLQGPICYDASTPGLIPTP